MFSSQMPGFILRSTHMGEMCVLVQVEKKLKKFLVMLDELEKLVCIT
jgi:hypothetical protein